MTTLPVHVFVFGWLYTCGPLLWPVVHELARRGVPTSFDICGTANGLRLDEWLLDSNPRVLVLATTERRSGHWRGQEALRAAADRDIPVVAIQHGAYSPGESEWLDGDVICAWSEEYVPFMRGRRMVVTGNPALDWLPDRDASRMVVARQLGCNPETFRYTLLATARHMPYPLPVSVYQRMLDETESPVVIREHPAEQIIGACQWYDELTAPAGIYRWPGDRPAAGLKELYCGAEEVIGQSTVLVEAEAAGVPVRYAGAPLPRLVRGGAAARVVDTVIEMVKVTA